MDRAQRASVLLQSAERSAGECSSFDGVFGRARLAGVAAKRGFVADHEWQQPLCRGNLNRDSRIRAGVHLEVLVGECMQTKMVNWE